MNKDLVARVTYAAKGGLSVSEEDLIELGSKGRSALHFKRREILRDKQSATSTDAESFRIQVDRAELYEAEFDEKYWRTHLTNLPYAKALFGIWLTTTCASYFWGFWGSLIGGAVSCSAGLEWLGKKKTHSTVMLYLAETSLRECQARLKRPM